MKVQSSTIENKYLRVKSINIGACLYEVYDKQKKINLILNLGPTKNYGRKNFYVGATCGRYAGRISNSKFNIQNKIYKLDGNEGKNTLHGGKIGFNQLEWKIHHHSKNKITVFGNFFKKIYFSKKFCLVFAAFLIDGNYK